METGEDDNTRYIEQVGGHIVVGLHVSAVCCRLSAVSGVSTTSVCVVANEAHAKRNNLADQQSRHLRTKQQKKKQKNK